jgi:hypothetical protein
MSSLPLLASGFQGRTFHCLWFPELPQPKLLASNNNGSQRLNPRCSLTHSLTNSSETKSKFCYDRRSVGQSVFVSSTHRGLTTRFLLLTVAGLLMWGALSDERTGLQFTTADPRQRSHSWVRVPRDSWPYFTVSNSRLPQPGGPGPLIYIPQEEGGPVILPGTGFPFLRLLRLSGLRWRYSNPPPPKSKS